MSHCEPISLGFRVFFKNLLPFPLHAKVFVCIRFPPSIILPSLWNLGPLLCTRPLFTSFWVVALSSMIFSFLCKYALFSGLWFGVCYFLMRINCHSHCWVHSLLHNLLKLCHYYLFPSSPLFPALWEVPKPFVCPMQQMAYGYRVYTIERIEQCTIKNYIKTMYEILL